MALDVMKAMGAEALSGVTFGAIGQQTSVPPTRGEYDNIAGAMIEAAAGAKFLVLLLGIEAVNRCENHLVNMAGQACDLVERVGTDNVFIHRDTYHMNIEEMGAASGILDAREHLRYIHLSGFDRGTPGEGNCPWDEIFGALAAIDYKGGLATESFIDMPPEVAYRLAVWRSVANSFEEVLDGGLPFLREMARQYRLI